MEPKFIRCSIFILCVVTCSITSARPLVPKQEGEEKPNQIMEGVFGSKVEDNNSMDQLMGLESCEDKDEECLKRRLLSEAHLDYIYTQHRRP